MRHQLGDLSECTNVNSCRVTGKPIEGAPEKPINATWGYGFQLDKSKVPKSIKMLVARIQTSGEFKVGKLIFFEMT